MSVGYAFAFIVRDRPPRFGHVGWGFSTGPDGGHYFGATEDPDNILNINSHLIAPGADNHAWTGVGAEAEMISAMRSRGYHAYRKVVVVDPDPVGGVKLGQDAANWGYSCMGGNNCMDHAQKILAGYGARDLPWPRTHWMPLHWFDGFPGDTHDL